jgi:hypothetical protein
LIRRGPGGLGCDGDDRDVVLGDAVASGDPEVGSKSLVWIGWMGGSENPRLSVYLDVRHRLEERDHRVLGLLVASGSGRLKGRADLCVSKVV